MVHNRKVKDMDDLELRELMRSVIHEEIESFIEGENPNKVLAEYFDFLKEELQAQKAHRRYIEKMKMSAVGWITVVLLGGILTVGAWVGKIVWQHFALRGF